MGQAGAGNHDGQVDERHAEAAGSVESHIGSPTPSLVVLHPRAPQRHSQIRRSQSSLDQRLLRGAGGSRLIRGMPRATTFVDSDSKIGSHERIERFTGLGLKLS